MIILSLQEKTHDIQHWCSRINLLTIPSLYQVRGFFKGMAFPVLTTGIINSIVFGSYSNALAYLTQSQFSDHGQAKPASPAQVFAAGCFSGLMQVRTPDFHVLVSLMDRPSTWSALRCLPVHPLTWWRCACRAKQLLTDIGGPSTVLLPSWRRMDPGVCSEEWWPLPWGTSLAMDCTFCLMRWLERLWLRRANSQVGIRGNCACIDMQPPFL